MSSVPSCCAPARRHRSAGSRQRLNQQVARELEPAPRSRRAANLISSFSSQLKRSSPLPLARSPPPGAETIPPILWSVPIFASRLVCMRTQPAATCCRRPLATLKQLQSSERAPAGDKTSRVQLATS